MPQNPSQAARIHHARGEPLQRKQEGNASSKGAAYILRSPLLVSPIDKWFHVSVQTMFLFFKEQFVPSYLLFILSLYIHFSLRKGHKELF